MNVSARDKKILMIAIPLVIVLGYWFMLLAPQRKAAADAATTLQSEQAQLADAQSRASTVQAAKASFAEDYAAVVALGKAIPTSVDMPSLLVQLDQAAHGTGIEFKGVTVGERGPAAVAAAAPTGTGATDPGAEAPTAPSGDPAQSAPGAAVGSAQQAADAATTPPADPAAAGAATTDPAAAVAAPSESPLEQVQLEFNFTGDFFALADFFHSLKRFVFVDGDKVRVHGRLMTINSVEYVTDPDTFPELNATVTASVFLTPKTEGVTAGATPAGPEAAAPAAAPVATASSSSTSPTPTATATP
jgi:type II secretion system (T2SS) protein M